MQLSFSLIFGLQENEVLKSQNVCLPVLLCDITNPAQLKSLSTAALDGSGVFSLRNSSNSCVQTPILQTSSDVECKYCYNRVWGDV